jgi:hypothetical protein
MPEYEVITDIFGDPVPAGTKSNGELYRIAMSMNDPQCCDHPGCDASGERAYVNGNCDVFVLCDAHYAGWAAGDRGERA